MTPSVLELGQGPRAARQFALNPFGLLQNPYATFVDGDTLCKIKLRGINYNEPRSTGAWFEVQVISDFHSAPSPYGGCGLKLMIGLNAFWNLYKKPPESGIRVRLLFRKVFADFNFIVIVRAKPTKIGLEMVHELSGSYESFLQIQALDCFCEFKPVAVSEAISH